MDYGTFVGWILYVKPTITGDEPVEVLNYRSRNMLFPNEPTGNQFFREEQFEAYRLLGRKCVSRALVPTTLCMKDGKLGPQGTLSVERTFEALECAWRTQRSVEPSDFIKTTDGWMRLEREIFGGVNFSELDSEVFGTSGEGGVADRHAVLQLIQHMEQVFVLHDLWRAMDVVDNQAWLVLFDRYFRSSRFRRVFLAYSEVFGRDFVMFCKVAFPRLEGS